MIFRAIALSMAILVGIGAILPLTALPVEASQKRTQKRAKKKGKNHKKYSRQWWRAYRQRVNRNKSLNARKRNLRLRQIRLAKQRNLAETNGASRINVSNPGKKTIIESNAPVMLPSGEFAPKNWKSGTSSTGGLQFRVDDDNGTNIGSAAISVVGQAVSADNDNSPNKTVGGVSVSALRRTVIEQMIREEGWVVNDYQKEVGGKKVYVVVAQSPGAGGSIQSRVFYFAEADGRIYSVSTNAPKDNSQRIEQESEKAIKSLRRQPESVQQAELKP